MRILVSIVVLSLLMVGAYAATTQSWGDLDRAARQSCNAEVMELASKAKIERVTGKVSGIGVDGDRYFALMVAGKTANIQSQWLCLYDKRAKTAQAREIEAVK